MVFDDFSGWLGAFDFSWIGCFQWMVIGSSVMIWLGGSFLLSHIWTGGFGSLFSLLKAGALTGFWFSFLVVLLAVIGTFFMLRISLSLAFLGELHLV